jgi:hypothetical protein
MTVAAWKEQRFMRVYPDFKAEILDDSGNECHDGLHLSDVRDTYPRK